MTKKHDHGHDHNLDFCKQCDAVYCLGCKEEWGKHRGYNYQPYWNYPSWNQTRTSPQPNYTVWASGTTNATDVTAGSHAH